MFSWLRKQGGANGASGGGEPPHAVELGPSFFVPGYTERGAADAAVTAIGTRLAGALKADVSAQRYAGLRYTHDGYGYESHVGHTDPRTGETVVCILHQPAKRQYLVCTPKRGAEAGLPLLVGDDEVETAVVFQDA